MTFLSQLVSLLERKRETLTADSAFDEGFVSVDAELPFQHLTRFGAQRKLLDLSGNRCRRIERISRKFSCQASVDQFLAGSKSDTATKMARLLRSAAASDAARDPDGRCRIFFPVVMPPQQRPATVAVR